MHAMRFTSMSATGKELRLRRLFRSPDGRALVVPMDHSLSMGSLGPAGFTDRVVRAVADEGADAVVLHAGRVRTVDPAALAALTLVVHLSGSTGRGPEANRKVLVGGVDDAMACGADAVSLHVNVGSDSEAQQLTDLGAVGAACAERGMPLLAMMYARGAGFEGGSSVEPAVLAHLAGIATDLGADVVKLNWPGSPAEMACVVASSPLPVLVAGGPRTGDAAAAAAFTREVVASGAAGLAMGRQIFEAPEPGVVTRRVVKALHVYDTTATRHAGHGTSSDVLTAVG